MKRFLGTLIVCLAVGLVVVGFFRGWFALSTSRDADTNKVNIQLQVDPDLIKIDTEKAKDKANEFLKSNEPDSVTEEEQPLPEEDSPRKLP